MKYRVVFPIVSDRRYAPGETIEPAADDAAAWLELGIIAELEDEQPAEGVDASEDSGTSEAEPAPEGDDSAAAPEADADELGEPEPNTRGGVDPEPGSEADSGEPDAVGDDPGEGSDPSPGDPDRHAAIVDAIARLDPKDRSLWSGRGKSRKPRVDAIEAVLGYDITAAERDAAWAEVQAGG